MYQARRLPKIAEMTVSVKKSVRLRFRQLCVKVANRHSPSTSQKQSLNRYAVLGHNWAVLYDIDDITMALSM